MAFKFHPDKNSSPGAQEKFITITEAYEMLMGERKQSRFKSGSSQPTYEQRQQAAKARARRQAQMRFDAFKRNNQAFKKSWYYYPTKGLAYAVYGVMLAMSILFLIAPVAMLIDGDYIGALIMLPLAIGGIALFPASKRYLQEIKPYFQEY